MFKLIDALFDRVAQQLADNLCENAEVFEQNRAARELNQSVQKASSVSVPLTLSTFTA